MTNPSITVQQVMTQDPTGALLVQFAKQKGEEFADKELKSTQIRNIFIEARRAQAELDKPESEDKAMLRLNMLRPKLAYQAKRHEKSEGLKLLVKLLTDAITEVSNAPKDKRKVRFDRFMDLFEAILAYHRASEKSK